MRNTIITNPNPDLIFCADTHIRSSTPTCRKDDYLKTQQNKLMFIANLSKKYSCPILIAGDLGNKAEWKNWLLSYWILLASLTDQQIYVVPGQHDLVNHELKKWIHSGIGVLNYTGSIETIIDNFRVIKRNDYYLNIIPCPFGRKIPRGKFKNDHKWHRNILVMHKMVIKDKPLWPGQIARTGKYFLKRHPQYDIIVSGDNHKSFTETYKNRTLVNPGSMMRMTVDQKKHRPRIYLYYAKTNSVLPVFIPIEKDVISTEHISKNKELKKRVKIYIEYLKKQYEVGLSFEKNIFEYLKENKVRKDIKKVVLRNVKRKEK